MILNRMKDVNFARDRGSIVRAICGVLLNDGVLWTEDGILRGEDDVLRR